MYSPAFGDLGVDIFFLSAFIILFSTFFVAMAGNSIVFADAMKYLRFPKFFSDWDHKKKIRILCVFFPLFSFMVYILFPIPKKLILLSGLIQSLFLPCLALLGIWVSYHYNMNLQKPSKLWRICVWAAALVISISALWAAYTIFNLLLIS
jgi:hypothetical protein